MKKAIAVQLFALVLLSCQSTQVKAPSKDDMSLQVQNPPPATMEEKENQQIEEAFMKAKIVMTLDDYPYSLWKETIENQSMFFRVYLIDYNGILSRNAIAKMRVFDNFGTHWDQTLSTSGLRIGSVRNNFSSTYSFNGSLLSVEPYRIEIETKNGKILRRTYNPKQHLRSDEKEMRYIFSNEYAGKVLSSYKKTLDRPVVTAAYMNDTHLNIEFSVKDPRVRNMSLDFYSKDKEYIGWTKFFYNAFSDETMPALNGGEKLRVDGTTNTVALPLNYINFLKGKRPADIVGVIVTAYDNEFPDFLSNNENMTLLTTKSEMTVLKLTAEEKNNDASRL